MSEREDKPVWSAVPQAVKARTERVLGARVLQARRSFGGYGPSATFALTLDDGRRAFFKGTYPLPQGSAVRWMLGDEERVYRRLGALIEPWAPGFFGSFRVRGWHVLLIEAVAGARVPPWTPTMARRAAESYARFHASTVGRALPRWLPRDTHLEYSSYWHELGSREGALEAVAGLASEERADALSWLRASSPALAEAEQRLRSPLRRTALLHLDTRSDNLRLDGERLRIFDWPFACVGPPEFDAVAFAQSIESEAGPPAEQVLAWYEAVLPMDHGLRDAAAAGIAGYFADRAPRPGPVGLPRLRTAQSRQLKATLRLAANLLELPPPTWLTAIPH